MSREKSKTLFEEAYQVIPGGVDSPVRAFKSVDSYPIFIKRGEGSKLIDVDGNVYTDYILSWGPLILGHAHPEVSKGIDEILKRGSTFGLPTQGETLLAEEIIKSYPSIEKIRFVNSGTEAVMSALRLARGYTNREKVVKFSGGYHGHVDSMLVDAGSGLLTETIPSSDGVTRGVASDTIITPYNNIESLERIFDRFGDEIAAVIVEPVSGNMGVIPPEKDFLESIIRLCQENGALSIFDEVITGYRVGLGGMQGRLGLKPDITTLGKIIGGGMPVGAFGGPKEIMDFLAPNGSVYQAGTLSGNPIAMAMGYNQLTYLREHPEVYNHLERLAKQLQEGLDQIIEELSVPASVSRFGGMVTLFFRDSVPKNYEEVKESDTQMYTKFFQGMLERGILLPPSQFEAIFLSNAHTVEDIDNFLTSARETLEEIGEKE